MRAARDALDDWPRPLLLGHRGCRMQLPENTMEAIEHATRQGVHGFEIDVRLSADGSVVVCHDPTLERLTDGRDTRAVASLSDAELARVDLGGGARIPQLAQVLAYCRDRSLLLDVEIKHDVPALRSLLRATSRLLHDFTGGEVLLTSFDPRVVAAFRVLQPRLPRALIVGGRSLELSLHKILRLLGGAAVCVDHQQLDAAGWARFAAAPRVIAWTVNSAERTAELLALGAFGVISDVPAQVLPALQ